jgi:SAM-dependent methyltransferase
MTKIAMMSQVADYYGKKIREHGATNLGVDWSSKESQTERFRQLSKIISKSHHFTMTDIGCGYGAYLDYLNETYANFDYTGIDISTEMIDAAKFKHATSKSATFICASIEQMNNSDYCTASGIFNVKLDASNSAWLEYIYTTLQLINARTTRGFSFNCLTSYSDKEHMKDYLYYADPLIIFDFCKRNFSKNIALLHDYQLYEFTILVRKEYE